MVLAIGMEPEITGLLGNGLAADIVLDSSNFIEGCAGAIADAGMFAAGAASSPLDVNRSVQSATAAALKVIQIVNKVAATEVA